MRLQKWMADAGVASRRKCEALIAQGLVSVNGEIAQLGRSVEDGDIVEYGGKRIAPAAERIWIAFNKPRGVLCTADDPQGRRTVMEYFADFPARLYNVGRLDYDSEGLLLMTNDGELAYRMTHPKYEIEKTYHVVLDAMLTDAQLETLRTGVTLTDGVTAPARVENIRRTDNGNYALDITIHEGKNREVRRMMQAMGRETIRLQRIRFAAVRLGSLRSGTWRHLTKVEVIELDALCK